MDLVKAFSNQLLHTSGSKSDKSEDGSPLERPTVQDFIKTDNNNTPSISESARKGDLLNNLVQLLTENEENEEDPAIE